MCKQRDSFLMKDRSRAFHLACVMNNPSADDDRVVVVNFSSLDIGKERWCIVPPAAHDFLANPSIVMYSLSRAVLATYIDTEIRTGRFKVKSGVSEALFACICCGFERARSVVPRVCVTILEAHGLLHA